MKNTVKKYVFIIGLIVVFIVCILIGINAIQTENDARGFKSQSVEVGTSKQQSVEARAEANINNELKNSASTNTKPDLSKTSSNDELPYEKQETDISQTKNDSCTITIKSQEKVILPSLITQFKDGETVFDILKKVTREKAIQMEFSGTASNVYVKGIDNLYEFDKGPQSGWLYSVNKEFPQMSCSAYKLSGGEVIEWNYTLNMGEDIKK